MNKLRVAGFGGEEKLTATCTRHILSYLIVENDVAVKTFLLRQMTFDLQAKRNRQTQVQNELKPVWVILNDWGKCWEETKCSIYGFIDYRNDDDGIGKMTEQETFSSS